MEKENNTRAGGNAQTKDVDDVPEQEGGGGDTQTEDTADRYESERAGGDAQSKGIS